MPVQLITSTTAASSDNKELGHPDTYGCTIEGLFYTDGARVPSNPNKPCELCYCIRNKTACVMQECTLNIEGCKPVYQEGVCCPVKYDCGKFLTKVTSKHKFLKVIQLQFSSLSKMDENT